jgi:hypothetical protein
MTAIAIWPNRERAPWPGLWIAADSRVSGGNDNLLVEDAAKVFPLPVQIRTVAKGGIFSDVCFSHSYGYCFSGSTIMGQNAYLALLPLLSNAFSMKPYEPSITDVAKYVFNYLRLTYDDFKARVASRATFEASLFGFCPKLQQYAIFHFAPMLRDGMYELISTEYFGGLPEPCLYLGSEKQAVMKEILAAYKRGTIRGSTHMPHGELFWPESQIPRHVIQACIDNDVFPSIGGDIQLGVADGHGFHPLLITRHKKLGETAVSFHYLGRELTDDLRFLGEAEILGASTI